MAIFRVENKDYSFDDFKGFIRSAARVELSSDSRNAILDCRKILEQQIAGADAPIYGVNTGFGELANVRISPTEMVQLQLNLLRSHSVGVGEPLGADQVRLALLLKIISLARGASGIRIGTVEALLKLLNSGAIPVVPSQGSVGASGDLAPLSHMALTIVGEGEVFLEGKRVSAAMALSEIGLEPVTLAEKEGLALINGTQISTAIALTAMFRLQNLLMAADIIGALSVDGLMGSTTPFGPEVQQLKRHAGNQVCARNLTALMRGSTIRESHRYSDEEVQDIYSLRCMPQVHGSCRDSLGFAFGQTLDEANSVSDNPVILRSTGEIISAGHFHGEAVALACDLAAIAAAELGNISERRIYALLAGKHGLPPFLTAEAGLNSGFMMAQVTAASLVSENKTLAHPASVDTVPTSSGQEDHVSMSTWAARKLLLIVANVEQVLAIEFLVAAQAVDFHNGLEPGYGTLAAYNLLRQQVPRLAEDRVLAPDIGSAQQLIKNELLVQTVRKVVDLV